LTEVFISREPLSCLVLSSTALGARVEPLVQDYWRHPTEVIVCPHLEYCTAAWLPRRDTIRKDSTQIYQDDFTSEGTAIFIKITLIGNY